MSPSISGECILKFNCSIAKATIAWMTKPDEVTAWIVRTFKISSHTHALQMGPPLKRTDAFCEFFSLIWWIFARSIEISWAIPQLMSLLSTSSYFPAGIDDVGVEESRDHKEIAAHKSDKELSGVNVSWDDLQTEYFPPITM